METNVVTFSYGKHQMAFQGPILPERWNNILLDIPNGCKRALEKSLGEFFFDNAFTIHANGHIINLFISLAIEVGYPKEEILNVTK